MKTQFVDGDIVIHPTELVDSETASRAAISEANLVLDKILEPYEQLLDAAKHFNLFDTEDLPLAIVLLADRLQAIAKKIEAAPPKPAVPVETQPAKLSICIPETPIAGGPWSGFMSQEYQAQTCGHSGAKIKEENK